MKVFAIALFVAALAGGCGKRDGAVSAEVPGAMRVMSYNIRLGTGDAGTPNAWPERREDLASFVRGLDIDVGGLQEVRPEQMAFLRGRFPEFEFVGEHRGADRVSDEASPVFYRRSRFKALKSGTFWLSETPDVPGVKGWGAACPRVCSYLVLEDRTTGRRFCFANTHTDHRSALAREKGMLLIIERMKDFGDGAPIVFAGDHNCRETDAPALAVSRILKNALYLSETAPEGPWRTYTGWKWRESDVSAVEALKLPVEVRNARRKAGEPASGPDCGPRIDYVYVSGGIRVLDYATVASPRPGKKLYPSDHFPVVSTVVLE